MLAIAQPTLMRAIAILVSALFAPTSSTCTTVKKTHCILTFSPGAEPKHLAESFEDPRLADRRVHNVLCLRGGSRRINYNYSDPSSEFPSRRPGGARGRSFSDARGRGRDSWRGSRETATPNIVRAYHEGNVQYKASHPSESFGRTQPSDRGRQAPSRAASRPPAHRRYGGNVEDVHATRQRRNYGFEQQTETNSHVPRTQSSTREAQSSARGNQFENMGDNSMEFSLDWNASIYDNCTEFEKRILKIQVEYLKNVSKEESFQRGRYFWDTDEWFSWNLTMERSQQWIEKPDQYVASDSKSLETMKAEAQDLLSEIQGEGGVVLRKHGLKKWDKTNKFQHTNISFLSIEVDPSLHLEDLAPRVNFSQIEETADGVGEEQRFDGDDFIFHQETYNLDDPTRPTCGYLEAESNERIYNLSWNEEWPTVLDDESQIPPGVFRFLGRTKNGGWRNPAKHTQLTGVRIKAPGRWFEEPAKDGTLTKVRGPGIMGLDHVFPWRDRMFAEMDRDDVPSRKGVRVLQPAIGIGLPDVLEWRERPLCDWMALHEGWFVVDVGRGRRVRPSHYCMRNGGGIMSTVGAWIVEGACSRQGPWSVVDMRGFDFDMATVNFEDKYFHHAKARQYILPDDTERGGFKEPEDGYTIPKSHCSITWRARDVYKNWYRFIRVAQFKANDCFTKKLFVQGFELYGELKIGCNEIEREEDTNPQEFTEEEDTLLAEEVEVATNKRVVSWDPRDLIDRERQKKFTGKTYAEEISQASRALEERFERLTEEALKPGRSQQAETSAEDGMEGVNEDNDLTQMSPSEILYIIWESENFEQATQDVVRWLQACDDHVTAIRSWVQTSSSHTTQSVDKTCKLVSALLQLGCITPQDFSKAVREQELADIISSDNPYLLKSLNGLLASHSLPTIASPDGEEEEGEEDLEHEMEMLRQLRLARSERAKQEGRTGQWQQEQEEEQEEWQEQEQEQEQEWQEQEQEQEWQEEEQEERRFAQHREGTRNDESSEVDRTSSTEPSEDSSSEQDNV